MTQSIHVQSDVSIRRGNVRRRDFLRAIPAAAVAAGALGWQETMIAGTLRGTGRTMLARQLSEINDDKALTQELYLRVFGREPSQSGGCVIGEFIIARACGIELCTSSRRTLGS